ncbi:hypothetical protein CIB84_004868 [Bambusicola thoracicus]|uniref:Uncharacterized protein n=1 Tax=Bambusicola thoracicus TaxID=9083 RepID=A0A2P4T4T3_BAMTH|nr:hypothetical protein CIB84_004868 [Bambusicola thoracicus]
MPRALCPHLQ